MFAYENFTGVSVFVNENALQQPFNVVCCNLNKISQFWQSDMERYQMNCIGSLTVSPIDVSD